MDAGEPQTVQMMEFVNKCIADAANAEAENEQLRAQVRDLGRLKTWCLDHYCRVFDNQPQPTTIDAILQRCSHVANHHPIWQPIDREDSEDDDQ